MRRSSSALALALLGLGACLAAGDAATPDDGGHLDAPSGGVAVTVTAPTGTTQVARDDLATDGGWVARVTYRAEVVPPSSRVDWMSGGVIRGTGLPPDYAYTASYAADGAQTLSAVVHGSGDVELGRADVTVTILPSTAENKDCHGKLAAIGVTFALGPDTMGIDDPVTVTLPLLGVVFASRASMVMDCGMALAFYRMVEVLVAHDVVLVTDGGSGLYNYRCVSASESPPCISSGFSLHAEGMAYDIAQIQTGDGVTSSFGTDWMTDSGPTCNAVSASAPNQLLHDVVCDLYQNGVYTVLLTPNYQAAQDYVHMDLTAGQMLIK